MNRRNIVTRAMANVNKPSTDPDRNSVTEPALTKSSFLELIKTPEYKDSLASLITPLVNHLFGEIEALRDTVTRQQDQISNFRSMLADQNKRILKLEEKTVRQDRSERLHNLVVTGLSGSEGEIKSEFIKIMKTRANLDCSDMEFTVRMPRQDFPPLKKQTDTPTSTRGRGIVRFVFSKVWDRRQVYIKRTKLKDNTPGSKTVYLSEDLTKEEGLLFKQCRELRKSGKVKSARTFEHKVYVKDLLDRQIEISNQEQLQDISQQKDSKSDNSFTTDRIRDSFDMRDSGPNDFEGFTLQDIDRAKGKADAVQAVLHHMVNGESFFPLLAC